MNKKWNEYVYMRYDVYITHCWKMEERAPESYKRLLAVKEALKKKGLFIYDGEVSVKDIEMISFATVEAHKSSRRVLVLVNEDYLARTNNINSHTCKEVRYTTTFPEQVDFAIIDESLEDPKPWQESKILSKFKNDPSIKILRFYNDELMERDIQVVVDHVNEHKKENDEEY